MNDSDSDEERLREIREFKITRDEDDVVLDKILDEPAAPVAVVEQREAPQREEAEVPNVTLSDDDEDDDEKFLADILNYDENSVNVPLQKSVSSVPQGPDLIEQCKKEKEEPSTNVEQATPNPAPINSEMSSASTPPTIVLPSPQSTPSPSPSPPPKEKGSGVFSNFKKRFSSNKKETPSPSPSLPAVSPSPAPSPKPQGRLKGLLSKSKSPELQLLQPSQPPPPQLLSPESQHEETSEPPTPHSADVFEQSQVSEAASSAYSGDNVKSPLYKKEERGKQEKAPAKKSKDKNKKRDSVWGFVSAKVADEQDCNDIANGANLSFMDEREMLQNIIDSIADEAPSTSESDDELNDTLTNVEKALKHAEQIAQDKAEKKDASVYSSMQQHTGLDLLKQTVFQEISNELSQRNNEIGWPVCLATASNAERLYKGNKAVSFAVGTSGGFVLLFTAAGKRCGTLGGLHDDEHNACGGCSCIELYHTGEALLAGFQTGHLVFFDTENAVPLKIVKDVRHPLHSVKWIGNEPNRAAMLDIMGNLKIVGLKKVLGLKTKFITSTQQLASPDQGILEIDATLTYMTHHAILVAASRTSVHFYHLKTATLPADSFYMYSVPKSVKPKQQNKGRERSLSRFERKRKNTMKRQGKPEKKSAEALPAMSWLKNCRGGGELVVVWHDYLCVFRVVESDGSDDLNMVRIAEVVLKHAVVACTFLAHRVVGLIDPAGRVFVADPHTEAGRNAIIDAGTTTVDPVTVTENNLKSFRQAVKGFSRDTSASFFILSKKPIKLHKVEIKTWRQRIDILKPQRGALDLAKEMKYDKASAVVGLPHLVSTRKATLNEVIKKLLREYMEDRVAARPRGIDAEDWWESLAGYTLNYCCSVEQPELIFSVLYPFFAKGEYANLWMKLLEPCIALKKVTGIPNHFLSLLVEWLTRGAVLAYQQRQDVLHCTGTTFTEEPFDEIINPYSFTVDLWVRGADEDGQCAASSINTHEHAGWAFITDCGSWKFLLGDGASWVELTPDPAIPHSTTLWTRLTAVYHSGELVFYINEEKVDSTETSYEPNRDKTVPLMIGGLKGYQDDEMDWPEGFKGSVKGLMVYSSPHNAFQQPMINDSESDNDDDESQGVTTDKSWAEGDKESKATAGDRSWYEKDRDHTSLDGLTLADVQSAVSEDEGGIGEVSDNLARMEISTRLDNILLNIEPDAMHTVGGEYAYVLSMAKTWHLYKAFASYHNKEEGGVLGFINPLSPMFMLLSTPMKGSSVATKKDETCNGIVTSIDDTTATVKFEQESTTCSISDLTVLSNSKPNNKVRKTLLAYLKNLFMGKSFHGVIPLNQRLDVKVQALEFLFIDDGSDSTIPAHKKTYRVLEQLLLTDASGLLDAISISFSDKDVRSPWKRGADSKATNMQSKFRLSRDKVTAILMNKMKASEFGPLEVTSTFGRKWPKANDMVQLFTLVADAISSELVQPKRFNKDMIKRIVAHLAYDCTMREKIRMQKRIQSMLIVAFDKEKGCWPEDITDEETMQFHKMAQAAGFTMLSIYLYKREANYSAVLRTYLQAHEENSSSVEQDGLFVFLEESMENMAGDVSMSDHRKKLQKAILEHLEFIVKVDSARAANIVVKYLQYKPTDIMGTLDNDKRTQFAYLKGMIEASNNNDIPAIVLDAPTVEKYIRLLCMYDESNILNFLRDHESVIDITKILRVLENTKGETEEGYGRDNAIAYLYSRIGKYKEGINRHFKRLQVPMKAVRSKLVEQEMKRRDGTNTSGPPTTPALSYDTYSPTTPACSRQSRRKSTMSNYSFFRMASEMSDGRMEYMEVLECKEGKAVTELVELCLDICKDSTKGGVEDISEVWFTLLEKLVEPKKILSDIEHQSRTLSKLEYVTAGVACIAVCVVLRSNRKFRNLEPERSIADHDQQEDAFDELAEVQKQESKKPLSSSSITVKKQTKKLAHALSPVMFAVNQKMQEVYTHYITMVLLKMMSSHDISFTDDQDQTELVQFVKKCKDAMTRAVADPKAAQEFKQLKTTLSKKTQRVETVVLKKILETHKDSTFMEYKPVLLGMLENARFEASMKKAFNDCLESDTGELHVRDVQKRAMAAPQKMIGDQPWPQQCVTCGVLLSEKVESTLAFACGHTHHMSCLSGSEKCTVCFGKSECCESKEVKKDTSAQPTKKHNAKYKAASIKKLNNRLGHSEINIDLLHGDIDIAYGSSALSLAPAPPLLESDEEDDESDQNDDTSEEFEDDASIDELMLDAVPFHENDYFLFP
eukprot:TRINITY_DN857_c2_g3_i2.p1 TRINITY_DN857_c2_g3~~TRINITY_DN857_c2_g3_i2.p1  ORF type:complete len:2257 (+),score=520.61 TRINITY_DN857_c2_g3_i2:48-6818(+)